MTPKKRASAKKTSAKKRAFVAKDADVDSGSIKLENVFLRKIEYTELDPRSFPDTESSESDVHFQGSIKPRSQELLEFELVVSVTPYKRLHAFEVSVTISANFRRQGNLSIERFAQFVAKRSGSMVLPYVREAVSSITARGIYGAYYIEPMVLEPKVDDSSLEHLIHIIKQLPSSPLEPAPYE